MKIYVLEEYNTGRTACISEDINIIRKQMCNKDFFDPEYNDYPILKIWENGVETEKVEGGDVLKRIAMELGNNGWKVHLIGGGYGICDISSSSRET